MCFANAVEDRRAISGYIDYSPDGQGNAVSAPDPRPGGDNSSAQLPHTQHKLNTRVRVYILSISKCAIMQPTTRHRWTPRSGLVELEASAPSSAVPGYGITGCGRSSEACVSCVQLPCDNVRLALSKFSPTTMAASDCPSGDESTYTYPH